MGSDDQRTVAGTGATGPTLAHALVHGALMPPETELAWLGACMSGADGWVCIVIGLGRGA
jgi:autophagy-related protein 5